MSYYHKGETRIGHFDSERGLVANTGNKAQTFLAKIRSKRRIIGAVWGAFGIVAVISAFFLNVGGFYSAVKQGRTPQVDVAYFMTDADNTIWLVDPQEVTIAVGLEELSSGRIPIPINLAVRNEGSQSLNVVRVELRYDQELRVEPGGRAKIDPKNRLLIYEHELGTLESIEFYTPIDTVDTIYIPFSFVFAPALALSSDGVPVYSWSKIFSPYSGKFSDREISIGVTIFASDRPAISGEINFRLTASVEVHLLFEESEMVPSGLEDQDYSLFGEDPAQHLEVLDHWQAEYPDGGFLVDYYK